MGRVHVTERNDAVLLALVSSRAKGTSVAAVVSDVLARGPEIAWGARGDRDLFGAQNDPAVDEAQREIAGWREAGYGFVSVIHPDYPSRLRTVHDAPPFLFFRGSLSAQESGGISIVGSRAASDTGVRRAREVARYLVAEGIPVISGLARGVDAAAHEATIDAGGVPVGVIATGIGATYTPATTRYLHELVASHGVLLSQFSPTAPAMKHTFIERNATMSGLGVATFIIEASEHSGARAQARLAMEHGRPVILTQVVATQTDWGRELASGTRRNVQVVDTFRDAVVAIERVREISSLGMVEKVLADAQ